MREIIYIQAGKVSNYTGTHFWNTQESYFAENSADTIFDSDVSFREGLSPNGQETYCPRLLLFDHKSNFGTLSKSNALLGINEDEVFEEDSPAIWNGSLTEHRQDSIPKSSYHSHLDESNDAAPDVNQRENSDSYTSQEDIRYWSDFSRVYYIPRTIQKVPDPAEWEKLEGDWNRGHTSFARYDEDHALMEGSLRLFLEECDSPQGIQVMNDTATFGGFIDSFLTSFRDQYTKLPCLVVPVLSPALRTNDQASATKNVINDAMCLRSLSEIASLSVPVQPSISWPSKLWSEYLTAEPHNIYHQSAILSAMLETATVSIRSREENRMDLSSFLGKLNWRGNTPFSELSGVFPLKTIEDLDTRLVNLSSPDTDKDSSTYLEFTRLDVSRGLSSTEKSAYDAWSLRQRLNDTFVSVIHTPSYPIPSSYPKFFRPSVGTFSRERGILSQPESCAVFSTLSTSSRTANLFSTHASAIERHLKRKPDFEALGFDVDEVKDLVNDLWTLHDNFDGTEDDEEM